MDDSGKPWWQSKGIWGGIIAVLSAVAMLFGYEINESELLTIVMQIVALAGGVLAVIGRAQAKKPIKRKNQPSRERTL